MDPQALASQIQQLDAGYNPTQEYNNALSKLGVSDARTRVQGLRTAMLDNENLLNNVEGSVTGRTQNSLVTEAQRQRLVSTEKQPLAEVGAKIGRNYNDANSGLTDLLKQADVQTGLASDTYKTKRQSLADQLSLAQKAQADTENKRRYEQDRQDALKPRYTSSGGGGGGRAAAAVDPASEFLNYLANQFKASGGAGNAKVSRQTQDSWANAWFDQMGVSQPNRQQYWNLFNKQYNRVDDPTKDWRYAR